MKLTTRTRYAVRSMVDLVNQPAGKPSPLCDIAQRQGVKLRYLEQIFQRLRQAKLIESKKGPGGGYFINRNPRAIKLSEIMKAVGESSAPVFCVARNPQKNCPRATYCTTRPYWGKLGKTIDQFFDSVTLHDVSMKHDYIDPG